MASRDGEIADMLNSMPKYVVSSTLTAPLAWSNSTLLAGDLKTAITDLKQGDGAPILVHGSAILAQGLLDADLVDDLRLMVFPVLVDGGKSMFPGSYQKFAFTLVESETALPNVVALTYSAPLNSERGAGHCPAPLAFGSGYRRTRNPQNE
jgi:dihydrofolate reductase